MLSYVSSYKLFIALTFSYIFSPFEYCHKFFLVNSSLNWLLHLFSLRMLSQFLHFKFFIVLIISSTSLFEIKADNDSSTSTFTTFWWVNFTRMLWSRLTSTYLYFAFLLLWWLKVYSYKDTNNNPKKTSSITHLWIFTSFHDVYSFIIFKFL